MRDKLKNTIAGIKPLDSEIIKQTREYWDALAKPVGSLGRGEDIITQIAGIQRMRDIHIDKRALVIFCADNGVLKEGVASSPQEITAFMAGNFLHEKTAAAIMCSRAGVDIFPVDVGMTVDIEGVDRAKTAYGTRNMTHESAMSMDEALFAIAAGIDKAKQLCDEGYDLLLVGEMGIGNTTTSTAVLSCLLGKEPEEIIGRGAGLDDEGLLRKKDAIHRAINVNKPDADDPIDILAKVGGFDIAAMTGYYLGAASCGLPVIMDGVIASAAALLAYRLCPVCGDYIIPSHMSEEPAMKYAFEELKKTPVLDAHFRLGEGTGAVALIPFIELMDSVYKRLPIL